MHASPRIIAAKLAADKINVHFKVDICIYIYYTKKTLPIYIVINSNSVELNASYSTKFYCNYIL